MVRHRAFLLAMRPGKADSMNRAQLEIIPLPGQSPPPRPNASLGLQAREALDRAARLPAGLKRGWLLKALADLGLPPTSASTQTHAKSRKPHQQPPPGPCQEKPLRLGGAPGKCFGSGAAAPPRRPAPPFFSKKYSTLVDKPPPWSRIRSASAIRTRSSMD